MKLVKLEKRNVEEKGMKKERGKYFSLDFEKRGY